MESFKWKKKVSELVLLMGYFPHYHNTEYYLHMNFPTVNTGMLVIIETYDSG